MSSYYSRQAHLKLLCHRCFCMIAFRVLLIFQHVPQQQTGNNSMFFNDKQETSSRLAPAFALQHVRGTMTCMIWIQCTTQVMNNDWHSCLTQRCIACIATLQYFVTYSLAWTLRSTQHLCMTCKIAGRTVACIPSGRFAPLGCCSLGGGNCVTLPSLLR